MAITFPRAMLTPLPFRAVSFDPKYDNVQLRSSTPVGPQVVNVAPVPWAMAYETPPLRIDDADQWKAWIDSLRGGARLFKAIDPVKRFARAYRQGYAGLTVSGLPFSGSGNLAAIAETLDAITISELPAGFKLQVGDLLSFAFGDGGQTLHRVTESSGAASGLGAITVGIEPIVPYGTATGVAVQLADPWCKAAIDPRSVQAPWQIGRVAPLRFSAEQSWF